MNDIFSHLGDGFAIALEPQYLLAALLGVMLGTFIGVLPGLAPSATISLLLPVTFVFGDPIAAFILFGGIFFGAMYGGSTTSILVNTPGESSSVVTAIDGYQMARQGRAGPALATAAIGSFIAGTLAVVGIMMLSEPLVKLALAFGPAEYAAFMVLALTSVIALGGRPAKAVLSTFVGLAIGTIGIDFQTGQPRFTFGQTTLFDGVDFVIAAIGLFAFSEALFGFSQARRQSAVRARPIGRIYMSKQEWRDSAPAWARGSVLGFLIGLLPGAGATIASFASYSLERSVAREPEKFGRGAIQGVAGPEAANNASSGGSMLLLLAIGIPASATTAVMLAALQGFGIRTGPLLLEENPSLVWALIASLYVANVMLLILNLPLVGLWVRLLLVPKSLLFPFIMLTSMLGVYGLTRSSMDLMLLCAFGVMGFVFRRTGIPLAPLVLGLVLGPLLEVEVRRALNFSNGDWSIFVGTGLSIGILTAAVGFVLFSLWLRVRESRRSASRTSQEDGMKVPVDGA